MPATASDSTAPQHPVAMIREAALAQLAAGTRVRVGSLGVHVTSAERPRWERDPRQSGVSPLGCVLLEVQPEEWDDSYEALAAVFETRVAYVEGLADGLEKAVPARELSEGVVARLYISGWEQGYRIREEFLRGDWSRR